MGGKMGGYEELKTQLERAGIPYGKPSPGYYERREIKEVHSVEKLKRVKHKGMYRYNFKIKCKERPGHLPTFIDKEYGFKELYKFIKSKPGLDKELGLDEYDMKNLSEGKKVKSFSWMNADDDSTMMELWSL
jgi:hypothetical protein